MADDIYLTQIGVALKRGLVEAGRFMQAEDHLAVQALALGGFSFVLGLVFF